MYITADMLARSAKSRKLNPVYENGYDRADRGMSNPVVTAIALQQLERDNMLAIFALVTACMMVVGAAALGYIMAYMLTEATKDLKAPLGVPLLAMILGCTLALAVWISCLMDFSGKKRELNAGVRATLASFLEDLNELYLLVCKGRKIQPSEANALAMLESTGLTLDLLESQAAGVADDAAELVVKHQRDVRAQQELGIDKDANDAEKETLLRREAQRLHNLIFRLGFGSVGTTVSGRYKAADQRLAAAEPEPVGIESGSS